ncbi:DUF1801 domain-containing protein [Pedobacter boryungensis]|uniref:DUF1801 domain-containing protein n=1 Tax=Pedobacter boryungensis TaxID=869962 RepID=A0ABX2DCJ0_9SPHI|nr:DUF1801 domain-containing protein [Pedobacter boryungensis]NQX30716.1 DUF1801 domain-containing protein [Pedobacter boryungensis]
MKTDFVEIFQTIRASLQPYAANGFTAHTNSDTAYELWSEKNVEIDGKNRAEVYFAGVEILEDYVAFYFMSEYAEEEIKGISNANLLELLEGKSCFHIKELDDILLEQITDMLAKGFTIYKQKGWV